MEFGGWTRTTATAGSRRPSDGKIGGLLRPTPTLYSEAELTESSGSVSLTKGGSGKSSSCEALTDAQRGHHTRCVGRISVASVGLEKARLSGRECSRRRPTGDRCSLCRTGEDGKVKLGRDA